MQDAIDEHEEVSNATAGQRGLNGRLPLAGTKLLGTDVRVGHLLVGGSWIGIEGDHLVRRSGTVNRFPIQANLEPSEGDVFQTDGLGLDRNGRAGEIDPDAVKVRRQGTEVGIDVACGCQI